MLQNVNTKVQEVPQSKAAANPWHKQEKKNDKH